MIQQGSLNNAYNHVCQRFFSVFLRNRLAPLFLFIFMLSGGTLCRSQSLTSQTRKATVDTICKQLQSYYIFQDKAAMMCELIQSKLQGGSYDNLNDANVFAKFITNDLQSVNNDKHISMSFFPEEAKRLREKKDTARSSLMRLDMLQWERKWNFGFRTAQILEGNIGYIDLQAFTEFGEEAQKTLSSSMQFLENTDAMIIDMRRNFGGSPKTVALVASYFLDEGVHLNSIYSSITKDTLKTYTGTIAHGRRRTGMPLYILTGKNTISGGEEFSYDLKNLKRATLVGTVTSGGANPARDFPVGESFVINVPFGKGINPITGTNWSGVGVIPDIACAEADALTVAHLEALHTLREKTAEPDQKEMLSFYVQVKQALLNGDRQYGYQRSGDSIHFEFNPKDYNIPDTKILTVHVASGFSRWNPLDKRGEMKKTGYTYKLTVHRNDIGREDYIPFKFVVNQKDWIEPPLKAKNKLDGEKGKANLYVFNSVN
jgi:hypothetical protein